MLRLRVHPAADGAALSVQLTHDPAKDRAILLDIEGTTTPVQFVYGVLFPFARARLRQFLETHAAEPGVRADMQALRREYATDAQQQSKHGAPLPPWPDAPERMAESAAAYALWLMDQDRKSTPLKSLQGRIWEAGYRSGELRGEVYSDVAPALARWRKQGLRMAIFSSGSVQAQQLLFRFSNAGDLTPYFDAYFDTTTGPKQDPQSYQHIAAALQTAPQEILFLSDSVAELDAARRAGLQTALCVRPGSAAANADAHPIIETFEAIA